MQQLIKQLREAEQLATKKDWEWSDEYETMDDQPTMSLVRSGFGILSCDGMENSPTKADANLIILMRNNIIALLDYVEELERELEDRREMIRQLTR